MCFNETNIFIYILLFKKSFKAKKRVKLKEKFDLIATSSKMAIFETMFKRGLVCNCHVSSGLSRAIFLS